MKATEAELIDWFYELPEDVLNHDLLLGITFAEFESCFGLVDAIRALNNQRTLGRPFKLMGVPCILLDAAPLARQRRELVPFDPYCVWF